MRSTCHLQILPRLLRRRKQLAGITTPLFAGLFCRYNPRMSEPWAVSKVAYRLNPLEDINEETRTDVRVIDGLVARCIARLTTAIEREVPPGFDSMQAGHIREMLQSMKW